MAGRGGGSENRPACFDHQTEEGVRSDAGAFFFCGQVWPYPPQVIPEAKRPRHPFAIDEQAAQRWFDGTRAGPRTDA
jgi:hypothetical protein